MKRSKKIVAALIALTAGGFLAISSTSVLASQPKTDMVDLSAWQGAISNLGYQNMKNSGVKAITIKATEGTFYKNPLLGQQTDTAVQSGMSINFYHFANFTTKAQAKKEAKYFVKAVESVTNQKNVVMVIDFESSKLAKLPIATNNRNVKAFNKVVKAAGYSKTDLYTNANWVDSYISMTSKNKGWLASYPTNPTGVRYAAANAWQWSSSYKFGGKTSSLDVSQMNNDYYLNS
ncbi:MAG: GH25 family lysozyme [Lentilactobacillus diolivorans]|uniref:GH25 family lysozyme n=1 Tax=Lentilactobacillus diolivorans TaxID=179838 RepID=UPI0039EB636F